MNVSNADTDKSLSLSMSDTCVPRGWQRQMLAHTAPTPYTKQKSYEMVLWASSQNICNIYVNPRFVFGHYGAYYSFSDVFFQIKIPYFLKALSN